MIKDYHKKQAIETGECLKNSPWLKKQGDKENFASVALKRKTKKKKK